MTITYSIPVKTPNPSNGALGFSRGAALAFARQKAKQRNTARLATLAALGHPQARWRVTLTRVSPGRLDAHDNLRSALKACADGVAAALGVDDGGGLVEWVYAQERGPADVRVGVEVLR